MITYLTHPWIMRAIFQPELNSSLIFTETGHGVGFPNTSGVLTIDIAPTLPWAKSLAKLVFDGEGGQDFKLQVKTLLLAYHRLCLGGSELGHFKQKSASFLAVEIEPQHVAGLGSLPSELIHVIIGCLAPVYHDVKPVKVS